MDCLNTIKCDSAILLYKGSESKRLRFCGINCLGHNHASLPFQCESLQRQSVNGPMLYSRTQLSGRGDGLASAHRLQCADLGTDTGELPLVFSSTFCFCSFTFSGLVEYSLIWPLCPFKSPITCDAKGTQSSSEILHFHEFLITGQFPQIGLQGSFNLPLFLRVRGEYISQIPSCQEAAFYPCSQWHLGVTPF